MAALLSPETFEFFATYLLAGYVVIIVRARFILGIRPKPAELIVEAIVFSLINQLVANALASLSMFTGLFPWLVQAGWFPSADSQIYFFAKILVLPSLMGSLLGYNLTSGWKNALLRRLSMPVIHPVQKGHDFAFGNNREPGFVIVTYFDGTRVHGFFGEQSLAATDPERSDLYLERLYSVDDDGEWSEPDPARSGLISLRDARSVEFLDAERKKNDE